MTREWQPGDVAMVSYENWQGIEQNELRILVARKPGQSEWQWWGPNGYVEYGDRTVVARPLVVVDAADLTWLPNRLRLDADRLGGETAKAMRVLADQIEDQQRTPKPDEPTGLGAVVEDADGHKYLRCFGDDGYYVWRRSQNFDGCRFKFDEIAVVKVLSEGVTP